MRLLLFERLTGHNPKTAEFFVLSLWVELSLFLKRVMIAGKSGIYYGHGVPDVLHYAYVTTSKDLCS